MRICEETLMRRSGPILAAAACGLFLIAGCSHKGVDDYLRAGDSALQNTKAADAEKDYAEAEKIAPDDPRVHVAMGNLYVFEHKPGPAQIEFMKVIELDPKNPAAHVALGNLYLDQQQNRLAEEQYRAAIVLDPTRGSYYLQLADTLSKEGRLAQAEDPIRTALGLDPRNAEAHLALANLLDSEPGRQSEGEAEMAAARAIDPKLVSDNAVSAAPPAAPSGAAPAPAAAPTIKPLNKLFLLTRNSPVYQSPDQTSSVVAQVKRRKYVHVIGIAGAYLQIKLRNGTIGFIPIAAAE
ncbi:MAG TPA: tetratricopeptide repeat protein [Candidatus Binataceae bacterium]|nr:tetratricopeptide repeat protein [Candidatus Binataceae bacterium]